MRTFLEWLFSAAFVGALLLLAGCTDEAYVQFQSCEQAREAGAPLPLTPDSPGWNAKLDRDKNGLAC